MAGGLTCLRARSSGAGGPASAGSSGPASDPPSRRSLSTYRALSGLRARAAGTARGGPGPNAPTQRHERRQVVAPPSWAAQRVNLVRCSHTFLCCSCLLRPAAPRPLLPGWDSLCSPPRGALTWLVGARPPRPVRFFVLRVPVAISRCEGVLLTGT